MTAPYYVDESVTLYAGDCHEVMAGMAEASVDAVVTDPPYGLEFMGKEWDRPWAQDFTSRMGSLPLPDRQLHVNPRCLKCGGYQRGTKNPCRCPEPRWSDSQANAVRRASQGFQAWCELWAAECLRVLKPGGFMLAFGGTRTSHRLTCAIEDAGFEIRDSITWLYGSGFPKSLDVSKAIDKAAGAVRETCPGGSDGAIRSPRAMAPGGAAREAVQTLSAPVTAEAQQWQGWGTALKPASEPIVVARKPLRSTVAANILEFGTGALNIDACRVAGVVPQVTQGATDAIYGGGRGLRSEPMLSSPHVAGRWPSNVVLTHAADCVPAGPCGPSCPVAELNRQSGHGVSPSSYERSTRVKNLVYGASNDRPMQYGHGDSGGASRFFPTFRYEAKAASQERPRDGLTAHPTVKPLELMRWLVRLVTPPNGLVLDPFTGSGTTGEACIVEGFRCVMVERELAYLPLIAKRLGKALQPDIFGGVA